MIFIYVAEYTKHLVVRAYKIADRIKKRRYHFAYLVALNSRL